MSNPAPERSIPAKKRDRDEILWEVTRSLCPACKQVIDAQVLLRANKVYLRKRCPDHGRFEGLIFGDAALYVDIARFNKPGTLPQAFASSVRDGCPLDCGLCPDHQQHACIGVIEVTNRCNLECPLCFANAGNHQPNYDLTFEQVESMLDAYVASEGSPGVVQFSGGEPTLHPQLLDFIALAKHKGIRYVMVNTNGIRIARDDRFLDTLANLKPLIYLQFDGFDELTNKIIRGCPDILEMKLRALDRLEAAGLTAVLVPAIERGINEHEVGRILTFGMHHPAVIGVSYQCAFRAQRHLPADPLQRITIPDIVQAIEQQTAGMFTLKDFVPVPCCMPVCSFVTYAMIQGDTVTPIPRVLPVENYLDYLKNRSIPGINEDLLMALERLWSATAPAGAAALPPVLLDNIGDLPSSESVSSDRCPACSANLPIHNHSPRDLGRHIFTVAIRDFMDPWTFHQKNAMKCCINVLTPDGHMIPFCAYNSVGYREKITQMLTSK